MKSVDVMNEVLWSKVKALIDDKRSQGVTDTEMQRDMGLPAHSINKWMTGQTKSYRNYIYQISEYFNVSVAYLTGETDKKIPAAPEDDGLDAWDLKLLEFIHGLPADRLRGILLVLGAPEELLADLDRAEHQE